MGMGGFLSRCWGKKNWGQENSLCRGHYPLKQSVTAIKRKRVKRTEVITEGKRRIRNCALFFRETGQG